ncbi:MAG: helix-hairpin-helix domain-containing protein [Bacteroidia bacterium]|nr:helix-hairpin-helix domain-containing protein [Bacteroidia bacterium]
MREDAIALRKRLKWWPSGLGFFGWILISLTGTVKKLYLFTSPAFPSALSYRVDINRADSLHLLSVPGLTPWKVHRLLRIRGEMGGFRELDEIEVLLGKEAWEKCGSFLIAPSGSIYPSQKVDLNQADSTTLVRGHLCRPLSARSLLRYRKKLGGFSSWEQIDSLKHLNAIEKYRLHRYGELGSRTSKHAPSKKTYQTLLDLNRASIDELEALPGIGRKTAERIVRYREKLLYFTHISQLWEIWGIHPDNLQKAQPYLYVGPPSKEPLSLRHASIEELAAHPYISWKLARQLVRERMRWGELPIPPEIWEAWLPDSLRIRLIPYLKGD